MIVVKCLEADREAIKTLRVKLDEIADDGTDYLGKRVLKPWGHEIERYHDEHCSLTWLHIHSHSQTSMHCHLTKTTMLVVAGGVATIQTLSETHTLEAGDIMVIEKGAFHQTSSGEMGVMLYEVETPSNKRDLVRLQDKYGREGMGYEHVA